MSHTQATLTLAERYHGERVCCVRWYGATAEEWKLKTHERSAINSLSLAHARTAQYIRANFQSSLPKSPTSSLGVFFEFDRISCRPCEHWTWLDWFSFLLLALVICLRWSQFFLLLLFFRGGLMSRDIESIYTRHKWNWMSVVLSRDGGNKKKESKNCRGRSWSKFAGLISFHIHSLSLFIIASGKSYFVFSKNKSLKWSWAGATTSTTFNVCFTVHSKTKKKKSCSSSRVNGGRANDPRLQCTRKTVGAVPGHSAAPPTPLTFCGKKN